MFSLNFDVPMLRGFSDLSWTSSCKLQVQWASCSRGLLVSGKLYLYSLFLVKIICQNSASHILHILTKILNQKRGNKRWSNCSRHFTKFLCFGVLIVSVFSIFLLYMKLLMMICSIKGLFVHYKQFCMVS